MGEHWGPWGPLSRHPGKGPLVWPPPRLLVCTSLPLALPGHRPEMSSGAEGFPCLLPCPNSSDCKGHIPFLWNQKGLAASPLSWHCSDDNSCQESLGWNGEESREELTFIEFHPVLRTEGAFCKHLFILSIINSFTSYFNKQPVLALLLRKPQNSKHHRLLHYLSQNPCDEGIILPILQMRKLKIRVVKRLAQVYPIYLWQS